jgi:mannose-6-phosphate isomerase class I
MGTHPDGPAKIRETNERLSSLIAQSDSASYLINNNDSKTFMEDIHLPFIMKIMSIKHTLSLQVHPNRVIL